MFLLVYVDDIVIMGSSTDDIQTLIHHLNIEFSLKDLGDLHYFLGIEVSKTTDCIHLSQKKYIIDLLKQAHTDKENSLSAPMVNNLSLS